MKKLSLVLLLWATAAGGQILQVAQFSGQTVGQKLTNAQAQCQDAAIPCILVLAPELAKYPKGSTPALCAQCSLLDYRSGSPLTLGSLSRVDARTCSGYIADGVTVMAPSVFNNCQAANKGKAIEIPKVTPWNDTKCDATFSGPITLVGAGSALIAGVGGTGGGGSTSLSARICSQTGAVIQIGTANDCAGCMLQGIEAHAGTTGFSPGSAATLIFPSTAGNGVAYGNGKATGADLSDAITVNSNNVTLLNVIATNAPRNGVRLNGNSGSGQFADNFLLVNVQTYFNGAEGTYCSGSDCNAGTYINVVGIDNGIAGMYDHGFLSNTIIGGQMATNGQNSAAAGATVNLSNIVCGAAGPNGCSATAAGNTFVQGQAVTVAGTTNYNGTIFVNTAGATFTFASTGAIAAETTGTVRVASAANAFTAAGITPSTGYDVDSTVSTTVLGVYSECDQATNRFTYHVIVIGGDICHLDYSTSPNVLSAASTSGRRDSPHQVLGHDTSATEFPILFGLGNFSGTAGGDTKTAWWSSLNPTPDSNSIIKWAAANDFGPTGHCWGAVPGNGNINSSYVGFSDLFCDGTATYPSTTWQMKPKYINTPGADVMAVYGTTGNEITWGHTTSPGNVANTDDGGILVGTGLWSATCVRVSGRTGQKWCSGSGSPNSVLVGSPGDLYTNTAGGAGTTLYVKESGSATNTGWVAK